MKKELFEKASELNEEIKNLEKKLYCIDEFIDGFNRNESVSVHFYGDIGVMPTVKLDAEFFKDEVLSIMKKGRVIIEKKLIAKKEEFDKL